MLEGVAGVIVAIGGLVAAVGVPLIVWINARSASRAREAEAKAAIAREAMKKASDEAAALAAKAADEASRATAQLMVIDGKIVETRQALDGRLSLLIEQIEKRAHAEGKAEGKTEEKADERDRKNGSEVARPSPDDPVEVKIVGTKGHVPVVVKEPRKD